MLNGIIVPHGKAAGIYGRFDEGAEGVPGSASFRLVFSQPKSRHIAGSIAAAKPFAGAGRDRSLDSLQKRCHIKRKIGDTLLYLVVV